MVRAALSWILPLFGLLVLGPLVAAPLGSLVTERGLPGATPLISTTPTAGLIAMAGVLLAAGVLGLITARLVDRKSGLHAMGAVLLWGAWRTGPLRDTLEAMPASDAVVRLAIEGGLVGLCVWLFTLLLEIVGHDKDLRSREAIARGTTSVSNWAGAGAMLVVSGIVVWFICREPIKNQAIFSALIAGIIGGALGRLAGQSAGNDPPLSSAMLGIAGLAIVGPLSALLTHGATLPAAAKLGVVAQLTGPMAFDWVAGACFGVSIGRGWAAASAQDASRKPTSKAPRRVTTTG